ncbi:SET MYND domain-containing protein, partial [Fusarium pseudoanthophilum]
VSNISDSGYLGIHHTVALMAPLLRHPSVNPHATLITLFMNMVDEQSTDEDRIEGIKNPRSKSAKRIIKYLPLERPISGVNDPFIIMVAYARGYVREFADKAQLSLLPSLLEATMKEKPTIIEKWPYRLKLEPEQKGGKEEFDQLMRGGPSGRELYLEWTRTHG